MKELLKNKKRIAICIVAVLVVICMVATTAMSVFSMMKINTLTNDVRGYMGIGIDIAQEDDVTIGSQYRILPTTNISDAYRSGDTSGLTDKEKETLDMASSVLDEIVNGDMTPYQRELAVYEWMTTNLKQDQGAFSVIPQTEEDCDNPYGVLKYHNAVCVGYATTFRLFMQMMEIECMVVHDTSLSHSWNLVKLEDDWYHTDVYFDVDSTSYQNFNMNDARCENGHSWNRDFFPAANSMQYSIGYQNKVEFEDPYDIPQKVYDQIMEGKKTFALIYTDVLDKETSTLCEAILSNVNSCVDFGYAGDSIYMSRQWESDKEHGYIAFVYITYPTENSEQEEQISPEQQRKIEKKIKEAFGTDWYFEGGEGFDEGGEGFDEGGDGEAMC